MNTRQPEAPNRIIHQGRVVESIGSVDERRAHQKDVQSDIEHTRDVAQKRVKTAKRRRNVAVIATVGAFGAAATVGAVAGEQKPLTLSTSHTTEAIVPKDDVYQALASEIDQAKEGRPMEAMTWGIWVDTPVNYRDLGDPEYSTQGNVNPFVINVEGKNYYAYFKAGEPNLNEVSGSDAANLMNVELLDGQLNRSEVVEASIQNGQFTSIYDGVTFFPGIIKY